MAAWTIVNMSVGKTVYGRLATQPTALDQTQRLRCKVSPPVHSQYIWLRTAYLVKMSSQFEPQTSSQIDLGDRDFRQGTDQCKSRVMKGVPAFRNLHNLDATHKCSCFLPACSVTQAEGRRNTSDEFDKLISRHGQVVLTDVSPAN
jgi:hypothetical protein